MLRAIALTVCSFIVATLFAAQAVWSSPLLPKLPIFMSTDFILAQAAPTNDDSLTAEPAGEQDKTTAQPNQQPTMAKQKDTKTPDSSNSQSQSGGPYDMEAIKAFNRALYGS
jgi:hypothetical protein